MKNDDLELDKAFLELMQQTSLKGQVTKQTTSKLKLVTIKRDNEEKIKR